VKIVSLLPSATEIVHALGRGDQLAGVTFECDFPLSARAEAQIVVGGLDTLHLRGAAGRRRAPLVAAGRTGLGGRCRRVHRRPGPRLVDGVELLAGVLHPDRWPTPPTRRAIRLR